MLLNQKKGGRVVEGDNISHQYSKKHSVSLGFSSQTQSSINNSEVTDLKNPIDIDFTNLKLDKAPLHRVLLNQ